MLTSTLLYFYFIFVDSYVMLLTLPLNHVAVRSSFYLGIQTLHWRRETQRWALGLNSKTGEIIIRLETKILN